MEVLEKLLRLADRPGTPEEGKAAMARAQEIAKKNNINLDDIRAKMRQDDTSSSRFRGRPSYSDTRSYGGGFNPDDFFRDFAGRNRQQPPPDPLKAFYEELNRTATQNGFVYSGSTSGGPTYNASYHKWTYRPNTKFYILMPHTENRMNRATMRHEKTTPNAQWYLMHEDKKEPITSGSTADGLRRVVQTLDFRKADADAQAEKAERERPKHTEPTEKQRKLEDVLKRYGYTLEPPQHPNQTNRTWQSSDRQSFVSMDGAGVWNSYTKTGDRLKADLKGSKERSPEELDSFLKKKTTEGTKLHTNPEIDQILQYLQKNGFIERTMAAKSSTRFFQNKGAKLYVEVGRANFTALGRITKDEPIYWKISSMEKAGGAFPSRMGDSYASFIKEIKAMTATGMIDEFENGPEAMAKLVKEFNFKRYDESGVAIKFRAANFVWFEVGEKKTSSGTPFFYYLGFHTHSGEYMLIERGSLKEDWKELEGRDVATLRAELLRRGFKPGQKHEADIVDAVRQMETICHQFGFSEHGRTPDKIMFNHSDKVSAVSINPKTGEWRASYWDYGKADHVLLGTGDDPMELYKTLRAHTDNTTRRPSPVAQQIFDTAEDFGFVLDKGRSTGEDMVMVHEEDKVTLEISKQTGGWELYFRQKIIQSGITMLALKTYLTEVYGVPSK